MHCLGVDYCATSQLPTRDDVWRHDWNRTIVRYGAMFVALYQPDYDVVRSAKARSALGHGIEHRLGIGRRAADDLEDVGGCRLLLERFRQTPFELVVPRGLALRC